MESSMRVNGELLVCALLLSVCPCEVSVLECTAQRLCYVEALACNPFFLGATLLFCLQVVQALGACCWPCVDC